MANTKLSALSDAVTVSASDIIYIVHAGTSLKATFTEVATLLFASPTITGTASFAGSGSGSTTLAAAAAATGVLTLPNATDTLVGKTTTDTLTNKTLTAPHIATIVTGGGTLTLPSTTDTLVGKATTDVLTNKTLTAPVIVSIVNTGTLTLPTATTTLVGRATTDTLTNKIVNNQSLLNNFSTSAQSISAATRTYIAGSAITVPAGKLQVGTMFRWAFNLTKTAAGSAASTFDIAIGTAGTTSDSAIVSFTKPAGTAAGDEGRIVIEAIVRGPLSASGVIVGEFTMTHNLASTGHMVIPCCNVNTVSSTFDVTTAGLIVGLCITSGTSDAVTIQQVMTECWNL